METLAIIFFGFLGAVVGSFIGVVAERLHTGNSWLSGRSACNSCGRALSFPDLVPIFSWLFTRGRCRTCGSRIGVVYLVLECALGLLFALSYLKLAFSLPLLLFLACLTLIAGIVLYDIRHTVVPPSFSIPLLVLSLFFAVVTTPGTALLGVSLLTAGVISGAFLLLYVLSGGRAMGLGDAPVALSLSLLVFPYAISGVLFSFWIGAVVGILILVLRRGGPKMGIEVPFVPFLALGFLLAYFIQWTPFSI